MNTPCFESLVKSKTNRGVVLSFFQKATALPDGVKIKTLPFSIVQRLENGRVIQLSCQQKQRVGWVNMNLNNSGFLGFDQKTVGYYYVTTARLGTNKSFFNNGRVFNIDKTKSPEELTEQVFVWVGDTGNLMSIEEQEMPVWGYVPEPGGWFSRVVEGEEKLKIRRAPFVVGDLEPCFEAMFPWERNFTTYIHGSDQKKVDQTSLMSAVCFFEQYLFKNCEKLSHGKMSSLEYLSCMPQIISNNMALVLKNPWPETPYALA